MPVLPITVNLKQAVYTGDIPYVCCNSDYTVQFAFDEEWDSYPLKTARFVYGKAYTDIAFNGTECRVPLMKGITFFGVGVYAGDLHTTTAAVVRAIPSVMRQGVEEKPEPTPEQYDRIMELINQLPEALSAAEDAAKARDEAQISAESAAKSAEEAKTSETNAAASAKLAEQVATANGYAAFEIQDDGCLYLSRTENVVDKLDFRLTDTGDLEVVMYG